MPLQAQCRARVCARLCVYRWGCAGCANGRVYVVREELRKRTRKWALCTEIVRLCTEMTVVRGLGDGADASSVEVVADLADLAAEVGVEVDVGGDLGVGAEDGGVAAVAEEAADVGEGESGGLAK